MGYYINPEAESKESFLRREGEIAPAVLPDDEDKALVCLVQNPWFSAAGAIYSKRELEAFSQPDDRRPKEWFLVSKEKLYPVVAGLKPTTFK